MTEHDQQLNSKLTLRLNECSNEDCKCSAHKAVLCSKKDRK